MFHKIKTVSPLENYMLLVHFVDGCAKRYDVKPLMDKLPVFNRLKDETGLFQSVAADAGGYGIFWDDELDLSCDELWERGVRVSTPFDNLIAFGDATDMWGLNESTLRKAVSYNKLIDGVDVKKFGKQ